MKRAASALTPIPLAASARAATDAKACVTRWKKCRSGNSPACGSIPLSAGMKTVNSYIGAPLKRVEDFRFLTGRGQYVGDLKRQGLLHAAILRSPVAHGTIVSIDASPARAMPGVRAVITAADIGANIPRIPMRQEPMEELLRCEQPVIADKKVRYVGEPVAVVVAETAAIAEDAFQAIELVIDQLPAVVDGSAEIQPLLFADIENNVATMMCAVRGDAE